MLLEISHQLLTTVSAAGLMDVIGKLAQLWWKIVGSGEGRISTSVRF